MQEREGRHRPLVRPTPLLLCAKNPLCSHRPLALIPVRFAALLVPLFTFPACSAAALADKHAAPPAAQDPAGEAGRAPRIRILHYLSRHNRMQEPRHPAPRNYALLLTLPSTSPSPPLQRSRKPQTQSP
jgi:hypothetical protein